MTKTEKTEKPAEQLKIGTLKFDRPREQPFKAFGDGIQPNNAGREKYIDYCRDYVNWITIRESYVKSDLDKILYFGSLLQGEIASEYAYLKSIDYPLQEGLQEFLDTLENQYFGKQSITDRREAMRAITWDGTPSKGLSYLRDKQKAIERSKLTDSEKCEELINGLRNEIIHKSMTDKFDSLVNKHDQKYSIVWPLVQERLREEAQYYIRNEKILKGENPKEKTDKKEEYKVSVAKESYNKSVECFHCGKVGHPKFLCERFLAGLPPVTRNEKGVGKKKYNNNRKKNYLPPSYKEIKERKERAQEKETRKRQREEDTTCFNCNGKGHMANVCPSPKKKVRVLEEERRQR
jgi:hypothetical protein